ncbi:MAG: helix-turn-helix domain-containing protein [bacterium]
MKLNLQFIFFISLVSSALSQQGRYSRFITPSQNSIIKDNIVKIALPTVIENDTLEKVYFYVYYSALSSNKMSSARYDTLIDIDSVPPFETIWDCSRVPDQDNLNLRFFCRVKSTKHKFTDEIEDFMTWAALDRNNELSKMQWNSCKTRIPVKVDANLEEWFKQDSTVFENNDNRITAYSKWDNNFLYFAVKVIDAHVFPCVGDTLYDTILPYRQDGMEFFFDIKHDHNIIRSSDDFQVIIPVSGKINKSIMDFSKEYFIKSSDSIWNPRIQINKSDMGYNIEAAFSWKEFGIKPYKGLSMGFNLVNSDREDEFGVVMTKSLAGISDLLHHNPSEWGDLCLYVKDRKVLKLALFSGIFLIILLIIFFYTRKTSTLQDPAEISKQMHLINSVKKYINQNFHNESFNLKKAALNANLSADYLRKLFIKETGEKFTAYLNRIRMHKAKELLENTNGRISEIAFDVGYTTLENFNKVFKKSTGMSPSEYRKRSFSRESP